MNRNTNTPKLIKPWNEATALLPCPFCGNREIVYEQYEHAAGTRWRCWCTRCMATIDPGYAQDACTVRQMWNKRA